MKFDAITKFVEKLGAGGRDEQMRREPKHMFEVSCVCSITDRPYVLQYAPQSGYLKLYKTIVPQASGEGDADDARVRIGAQALDMDEFASLDFPCPWCGAHGILRCGECRALVCSGRTKEGVFHCRTSCGATSESILPMKRLPGHRSVAATQAAIRPKGPAGTRLASGTVTAIVTRR